MRKALFIAFILGEMVVAFILVAIIVHKISERREINVNVIDKGTIDFPLKNSKHLSHYYEPKANIQQKSKEKWLSFHPIYTINSDTLNEARNYPVKKSVDTFRIVTIGDSFTFGQYVNTKDNWTELLETKLSSTCTKKKYEVINIGVGGYDLAYSVNRYLSRGKKYNPDLLIFLLKDDDFSEIKDITANVKWDYVKKFESNPANASRLTEGTIDLNSAAFEEGIRELRKYYSEEEVVVYQLKNLQTLIDTNKNLFIMNVYTYSPQILTAISNQVEGHRNVTFEPNLIQPIQLIDQQYTYLPFDMHPNTKGHMLIADRVYNYLVTNKLVPCE